MIRACVWAFFPDSRPSGDAGVRAEARLAVRLRPHLAEREHIGCREVRLDSFSVRLAHVDAHVRFDRDGPIRIDRRLGRLAARARVRIDEI